MYHCYFTHATAKSWSSELLKNYVRNRKITWARLEHYQWYQLVNRERCPYSELESMWNYIAEFKHS